MNNLPSLREGWDSIQQEETRLLRTMTIQESIEQWLVLQAAFEWQLEQSAHIFAKDRHNSLIELQNRLQQLRE
jgi:hypothetical protein